MTEDKGLEAEVSDHFKRMSIMRAEHKGQSMIYALMMQNKYGTLVSGPSLRVDWKGVFMENQCPQCGDLMSLDQDKYVSPKCKLSIPLELYDRAAEEYKSEIRLAGEDQTITKKIADARLSRDVIRAIYKKAQVEAQAEMELKRRREEANMLAKTGEDDVGRQPKA